MKKVSIHLGCLILALFCTAFMSYAKPKVIHVVVALCDNQYQNIAPVPTALGNGQDPKHNLYWGAVYGFKTFFAKQKEWQVVQTHSSPNPYILDEIIYKHRTQDVYIIAQAYNGKYIDDTIRDFMAYSAGQQPLTFEVNHTTINAGGRADLVVYIGHDALMEWAWQNDLPDDWRFQTLAKKQQQQQQSRYAAVFACQSRQYFSPALSRTGISPLILTTQNMAPEAYSVHAMIDGWVNGLSKSQIRYNVAASYSQYQKLAKPALSLFATEY